jgi:hypothetical protein
MELRAECRIDFLVDGMIRHMGTIYTVEMGHTYLVLLCEPALLLLKEAINLLWKFSAARPILGIRLLRGPSPCATTAVLGDLPTGEVLRRKRSIRGQPRAFDGCWLLAAATAARPGADCSRLSCGLARESAASLFCFGLLEA